MLLSIAATHYMLRSPMDFAMRRLRETQIRVLEVPQVDAELDSWAFVSLCVSGGHVCLLFSWIRLFRSCRRVSIEMPSSST
jgi:hypothetical protein